MYYNKIYTFYPIVSVLLDTMFMVFTPETLDSDTIISSLILLSFIFTSYIVSIPLHLYIFPYIYNLLVFYQVFFSTSFKSKDLPFIIRTYLLFLVVNFLNKKSIKHIKTLPTITIV